jgi:hypothetical protein
LRGKALNDKREQCGFVHEHIEKSGKNKKSALFGGFFSQELS